MTTPAKIATERRPSAGSSVATGVLSPASGPSAASSSASGASSPNAIYPSKRLSHDDTMEAIEDDVEGEEQEMKLLDEQQQRLLASPQAAAGIAPPAGFYSAPHPPAAANSRPNSSLGGPSPVSGLSIQEEDEDSEGDPDEPPAAPSAAQDDDAEAEEEEEESSISVSQQHGVVVTQERSLRATCSPSRFNDQDKSAIRMKRFKRSSSNSSSSSASSSLGSNRATPVMSSPSSTPSKSSTATGSSRSPAKSADSADRSDKSELLEQTPTRERRVGDQQAPSDTGNGAGLLGASPSREQSARPDGVEQQLQPAKISDKGDKHSAGGSTESATHAILEHLSHHHHHPATESTAMVLDEPAPSLELCRLIDPQQRRANWRRESESSRGSAATRGSMQSPLAGPPSGDTGASQRLQPLEVPSDERPAESVAGDAADQDREDAGDHSRQSSFESPSRTGTMKRRRRKSAQAESRGPEVADPSLAGYSASAGNSQVTTSVDEPTNDEPTERATTVSKRPPPLSRLKSPQTNSGDQQPQSSTLDRADVDGSICSSCSCMETSFDQTIAARDPMPQITEKRASASKQPQPQPQQPPQQQQQQQTPDQPQAQTQQRSSGATSSSWMSQEEGTVFTENYWLSHWLYISEHEEAEIWRRAIGLGRAGCQQGDDERAKAEHSEAGLPDDMTETASTISERSFNTRYKSTTRKMIHRRASIEMFKRIMANNLKREKRVEISRSSVGEFGFRIHGSRPVVVSAIERGTSAETCGLQVGDLIYAINETNILDMAHSDVVRLAHDAGSSALILDLIPTNDFLRSRRYSRLENKRYEPTVTGYLMRLSPSTAQPLLIDLQEQMASSGGSASSQQRAVKLNKVMRLAWRPRYFVLRSDNCLYWYRSPEDMVEPHGGLNLQGFSATLTDEFSEPDYVIRLVKYGGQPHYLGSNNMCDIQTWVDAINRAATEANQNDPYMKRTLVLARGKPNQIEEPDCSGWLYKFSHKRGGGAHWRAAYFVLKDACLYLFRNQKAELVDQASAVYYLHGYRVRSKHIEHKKHTFELIPPNRKTIKPMFLMASNEIDKKRWIAALEYSIDRWIEVN